MDLFLHDLKYQFFTFESPYPFFKKQGLYLKWLNDNQEECFSDVCLLPGFSVESYDDVLKQLTQLQHHELDPLNICPSLHFALYHPLHKQDVILPQTYQALIQKKTFEDDLKKLSRFNTVKIKTKDFSPSELISLILKLEHTHTLRFDANRQLLDQTFIDFLKEHPSCYDYIEEPLLTQKNVDYLHIAVDETIYLHEALPCHIPIKAIIYKPTLCGGLARMSLFMDKYPLVLSSCYESTLGLKRIIKLHQSLYNDASLAIGLDTMPLDDPFKFLSQKPPKLLNLTT